MTELPGVSVRSIIFLLMIILNTNVFAEEGKESLVSVEYLPLNPKFVVNLQGRKTYLRVDIQLMIEGPNHVEKIRVHVPAMRHALILLFSSYESDQLSTPEQREALRESALQEVRLALDKYAVADGLRNLFFTEFLVQ